MIIRIAEGMVDNISFNKYNIFIFAINHEVSNYNILTKTFQKVNFNSIQEFMEFLPADELKMVQLLRKVVLDCLPNCTEKLSYNVPFYKINKGICFIWPASVLWGKKISFTGVRFGFNQGYLMRDEINFLDRGNRKQVFWKDFKSIKEIDVDLLKTYIFEASEIDRIS